LTVIPLDVAAFWSKAKVLGVAQCWEWQAHTVNGYGKFRGERAHRYAYHLHKGEIGEGLMIRHLCGNKLCVNPRHLEEGTMKDNATDGILLGETLRGEMNGKAKISEAEARYIIDNPDGHTGSHLALKFGVSKATITLIQQGKRWAHLQPRKSA
jgi:hypothetical protein